MASTVFTNTLTEAEKALTGAARKEVGNLLLAAEVAPAVAEALKALRATGAVFLCGLTVRLTHKAQDALRAASIRSMSDAAFERFAYGK